MNYQKLIENRRSYRSYKETTVSDDVILGVSNTFKYAPRLLPEADIGLLVLQGALSQQLSGIAGYEGFAIEAPLYAALLTSGEPHTLFNAGYVGEELLLYLTEQNMGTCWSTFKDSETAKIALGLTEEKKNIGGVIAFGHPKKDHRYTSLYFDNNNLTHVDVRKREGYISNKRNVEDLVYIGEWGKKADSYARLDRSLLAALDAFCLAPSFLNRQPYRMLLDGGTLYLISQRDALTTPDDLALGAGVSLRHFAAVYGQIAQEVKWTLGRDKDIALPEDCEVVGYCRI